MRLFLAVELDAAVVRASEELVARLRDRAQRLAPAARITWASAGRLHVTLAFLGQVAAARTEPLLASFSTPIAMAPFAADVRGLGAFPPNGPPRVLWAGVGQGSDRLIELAGLVSGRLAVLGFPAEDRPYHPHVTLARVREAAGLRGTTLFERMAETGLGTTQVRAITLFESRLSPRGPAYVRIQRTALEAM